jgi:hypothetical protein
MKLEKGMYKGKLVNAGVGVLNTEKGTAYMFLTFDIDRQMSGGQEEYLMQTETRDVRFWLSDAALPYTEKDLARLGFNGNYDKPEFMSSLYIDGCQLFCGERPSADGQKTYEDWATTLQQACLLRRKSGLPTDASGCSSWPTAQVWDSTDLQRSPEALARAKQIGGCANLREVVTTWPTPNSFDSERPDETMEEYQARRGPKRPENPNLGD